MHSKKGPIAGLRPGDRVEDIFVVKIKKGVSPYANGYFFTLLLTDSSGKTIDFKYWGKNNEASVRQLYDSIKADSIVLVHGRVAGFRGKTEIHTNPPDTIKVLSEDEYSPDDFIMSPKRNMEEMTKELHSQINSVQNSEIKKILEKIFVQDKEFLDKFKAHPGAIEIHHNWRGGLLQHSLEIARFCDLSKQMFPELDRDLMIAGALLHDIGKVEEIAVTSRIKGTRKGQLKGHTALSYRIVANVMEELGISEETRDKVSHIILSHLGKMEYGAAKEPMFSEAVAVHFADEMSAKLAEMVEFIKGQRPETEDDFMWSRRHKRNIYLK